MKRPSVGLLSAMSMLAVLLLPRIQTSGATFNWKANTTGDWSDAGNWVEGSVPGAGDDVVIANAGASAILSSASSNLSSLTLSRTLTFTNWNTYLWATNVSILSNGNMTCFGPFTNNAMSNNVYVLCTNITIDAGGGINVDYKGYAGAAMAAPYDGYGPGGGQDVCGASYGGRGADYPIVGNRAGNTYGSLSAPDDPGSGGGSDSSGVGGHGGGAIRFEAGGHVLINGTISANGQNSTRGGGSGGGIYVTCNTFAGTNGVIRANGGNSINGDGGGGRIAVIYDTTAQASLPKPTVVFSAGHGTNQPALPSDLGTLYFPDNACLDLALVPHTGRWLATGATNLTVNSLLVTNGNIRFPADGFRLDVTNDLVVTGSGKLEMGGDFNATNLNVGPEHFIRASTNGPVVRVGGNLILTNSGSLVVYAGATNVSPDYGALVSITNDIFISTNCWIYPHSNPTNGGSVLFRAANLRIPSGNCGINADGRGFLKGLPDPALAYGLGPGAGQRDSGASYGGKGAGYFPGSYVSGPPYGSAAAPIHPGSGGGGDTIYTGGNGGGAIRVEATGAVLLNGTLTANGNTAQYAGGSGGGIYVTCDTISGTGGVVRANGGGSGIITPGGGGRISLVYNSATQQLLARPSLTLSANRGIAGTYPADIGTVYLADALLLDSAWMPHSGQFLIGSSWSVAGLVVTNGNLRFTAPGFQLTVTNDILVTGSSAQLAFGGDAYTTNNAKVGRYEFIYTSSTGPVLTVGGDVMLTNGGAFAIYGGLTNPGIQKGTALVDVNGRITINSNCWIYPHSHPTNGGSVFFDIGSLYIAATNGGIDAGYRGYRKGLYPPDSTNGHGPGRATGADSGGGYGGTGGYYAVSSRAGQTYGNSNAPVQPGSSGFGEANLTYVGGNGGGLIRIEASGTILVKGRMLAGGEPPTQNGYGGGSGGGIYLRCQKFDGDANGRLIADGGSGGNSGGGGGRIAVYRSVDASGGAVTTSVSRGGGVGVGIGSDGTVVWGYLNTAGTLFTIR